MTIHAPQRSLSDFVKQQRIVLSCSLIVGLFLILMGHIPVLPVLAGCALAVGISVLRSSGAPRTGARRKG